MPGGKAGSAAAFPTAVAAAAGAGAAVQRAPSPAQGPTFPARLSSTISDPMGENLLSPHTGGALGRGAALPVPASMGASHGGATTLTAPMGAPHSMGAAGAGTSGAVGMHAAVNVSGGGSGGAAGSGNAAEVQLKMMSMLEQHMAANPTDPEIPGANDVCMDACKGCVPCKHTCFAP